MKWLKFKSVKTKLVVGMIIAMFFIFAILLAMSSTISSQVFKTQVKTDMTLISNQVAEKIRVEIENSENMLVELAASPFVYDDRLTPDEGVKFFADRAEETGFEKFFYVSLDGNGFNLDSERAKFNVKDRDYFQEALKGKTNISNKIIVNELTGKKSIIIATPAYKGSNGELIGVFCGIKNIDFISNICKKFKWGESGGVGVYTDDGNLVGHAKAELVEKGLNLREGAKNDPNFKEAGEFFEKYFETGGIDTCKFAGSKKVACLNNIQGTEFISIVAIDEKELYSGLHSLQRKLLIASILLLIVVLVLSYRLLGVPVARSFTNLKVDIENLSSYDLSKELVSNQVDRRDEVGAIHRALATLKENLVSIVSNISAHAQNTAATSEELSSTAQATAQAAKEVDTAVSNIAAGATSQAQDTQSAASSVGTTNSLIMHMMDILKELADATETIDKCKDEGHETLKELISITEDTKKVSVDVGNVVHETSVSTEKIASASDMIQSISDQTNLLALNAAIEAARAGEAGKGFSVVAEEIRKLSEQSAGFTAEIKVVIDELKEKSESAVAMMENALVMIESQSAKVAETGNKFDEISRAVEHSKSVVDTIEEGAKTIENENQNVVKVVENLSAIAEENAATTEEAAASVENQVNSIDEISHASENLAQIATNLQMEVSKFIL